MKELFCLDIKDYDSEWPHSKRPSARGIIIFDENGNKHPNYTESPILPTDKIALVHSKKYDYYKFPGGGINANETPKQALIREIQEEIGLKVIEDSIKEYGISKRFQSTNLFFNTIFEQDSFYFFCNVLQGENSQLFITQQKLDPYEEEAGFELSIISIEQAIKANQTSLDEDTFSIVMIERDTRILEMLINRKPTPTRKFAEFIFNQSIKMNPGPWENHSKNVAKCAEKIAIKLLKINNGLNEDGTISVEKINSLNLLNPEKAYIAGLLHDIGRRNGKTYLKHVYDGFIYLKDLGYDDEAKICLSHSFHFAQLSDYIGEKDLEDDKIDFLMSELKKIQYNDYDYLIQLLDAACNSDGTVNLETRMNDVKKRYGRYPFIKWARNFELKNYFEQKLNMNLYEALL